MTADVTFRDFAGAIMSGNTEEASRVLTVLLDLDAGAATAAAVHFQGLIRTGGPEFMMKAMSLRTAVTSGDDGQIRQLLRDCFALPDAALASSLAALHTRYHPRA